ncbi:MAG TPA: gluconate:H+ symporter [Chitinophagaceae bacterium]|nr:gluconate:H+ symporter [Chitinophagaceae bacterium]
MSILIVIVGIIGLVLLISWLRVNTFLSFLIVSLALGLVLGLRPVELSASIQKGIGSTLGSLVGIIALGAMLGKLVAISGAAQQISTKLIEWVGVKHLRWAFLITGFIVGLPLFYSVGFMLLVPIAITVAYRNNLSAVYVGLPLLASLSVTQGYLPPHPAPLFLVEQLHADMGTTLWYGIIISVPAILVSGALYGSLFKNVRTEPNLSFVAPEIPVEKLPSAFNSILTVLLPIILIAGSSFVVPLLEDGWLKNILVFVGDATVSLLITIIVGLFSLGVYRHFGMRAVNRHFVDAVAAVASIILIFGGAGALKQVLTDGGVTAEIARMLQFSSLDPYVLGWAIAAIIRVCVGSSTVSGITTAGFIAPMMASKGIDPNLMVLSIGSGSMMFSHVNDTGFWLFREYFRLSLKDTIRTWSVMDTIVSVMGLVGVLALARVI